MHDFVQIVQAVAWPLVVLAALLLLRRDLASLVDEIAGSFRRSRRIKYKGFGVALELAGEIAQDTVKQRTSIEPAANSESAEREFEALAVAYRDLKIADPAQRAAERRRLADRLGGLAIALRIDRHKLSTGHEGERVALATAVLLSPARGDLGHLLSAASPPSGSSLFRFTGYRIVLALTPTLSHERVGKGQLDRVEKILNVVEQNANAATDEPLQTLIDRTRAVVEEMRRDL
ncbi:hypothetical protein [Labrys wisconsinensis]|uniref:Uncharacterized protein n=1 Tax=Labrys wisconsinensis TaxID=425677 RepID=A0ABU0J239_9HYPH|nr:hypothetical protein [Labrys wisconsinensis]MDQ0467641.1 hypothetical protein [Labrys wisconsinensis]